MGSILVTGGAGFLGRHLVSRLAAAGELVVSYNRDPATSELAAVTCVQGELYDLPRLVSVCREHGVDRIVHTAAMSHPQVSLAMPVATFAANVDGTLHVFEAARIAGVARIVNFSSEAVFGDHPEPVDEDSPFDPDTPYAVTKVTGELLAEVYRRHYRLEIVSLRPTELYGPGNRMPSIVFDLARAAADGRPFRLESGADHSLDLVHVGDVARAAVLALARPGNGGGRSTFNVSGGVRVTVAELSAALAQLVPGARLSAGPGLIPDHYVQGPWSLEISADELGYRPTRTLASGLTEYVAWLREHPH